MSRHAPPGGFIVWATMLRPVVQALRSAGRDPARVLGAFGLDLQVIADPDHYIPAEVCFAIWERLAEELEDPDVGIHIGEVTRLEQYGVFGYALLAAETIGQAWRDLCRFHGLVTEGTRFELSLSDEHASMRYRGPMRASMPRVLIDEIIVGLIGIWRQTTDTSWSPVEVRFAYPEPDDTREHARVVRAPITFGAVYDEIIVERALLDQRQIGRDPALAERLGLQILEMISSDPGGDELIAQVRAAVARHLSTGQLAAPVIARQLGVGERTLRRQLADRDTSLSEVTDQMRAQIARAHLAERSLSIAEIAFVLGFSEASAFHRAFRRWTGTTPAAFRSAPH